MYKANLERLKEEQSFQDYDDYLKSLNMTAIIKDFDDLYIPRITQLINKTNQFNLTTRRFTQSEIEEISADRNYLRLYGKLTDKFGDNGLISVVIGKIDQSLLHLELWLMSCRVLKRNMEHAMLDTLVAEAQKASVSQLRGYYYKTAKNEMVKDFYKEMGFEKISQDDENSVWKLDIANYQEKNRVIQIIHG